MLPKGKSIRRKNYKVLANGILSSFISRNNDVHGYWGIGKLYSLSESLSVETIRIDLLTRTISPEADRFNSMINHFADGITHFQNRHSLPSESLVEAEIIVTSQENQNITIYDSDAPHLLKCKIVLVCDSGQRYSEELGVRCRPHDPRRELKSTREYD